MNPIQTIDYIRILPELVLTAFGIIVMMADPLLKPGASRKGLGLVALGGTIAAIAATFCSGRSSPWKVTSSGRPALRSSRITGRTPTSVSAWRRSSRVFFCKVFS